jgi:amino acid adenylation domain-containing protein
LGTLDALWRAQLPPETQQEFAAQPLPVTATFVALGGNSLGATKLQAAITRAFGVTLSRSVLLGTATLGDLAAQLAHTRLDGETLGDADAGAAVGTALASVPPTALAQLGASNRPTEAVAPGNAVYPPSSIIPVHRSGGPLPASSGQQRFWVQHELDPDSPAANVVVALHLVGELDTVALHAALQAIIDRHEILRTVLVPVNGDLQQVILPTLDLPPFAAFPGSPNDCSQPTSDEARLALALMRSDAVFAQPFDLAEGPLLRARLFYLGAREHVLTLTLHHCICDAWSMALLDDELTHLYAAARGRAQDRGDRMWWREVLPPPALHYADYAAWQRAQVQSPRAQDVLAYWRNALRDAPQEIDVPTDYPRPARPTFAGAHHGFRLSAVASARLRALCRAEGATPAAGLLAVFTAVLARYSRQDDLVVGVPLDGRDQEETQALLGLCVNTAAVRARFDRAVTFRTHIRQMWNALLAAKAYGDAPFDQVVRTLMPARSAEAASGGALFNVMFAFQNAPDVPHLAGLHVAPLEVETSTSLFDLTLETWEAADGSGGTEGVADPGSTEMTFAGRIEYRTDLFRPETIARLAQHVATLLERALMQPDAPLVSLALVTTSEWDLFKRWNTTALPEGSPPPDRRLVDQIVEHVARHPSWPALVADIQGLRHAGDAGDAGGTGRGAGTVRVTLTYRQLWEAAHTLARKLVATGVGPDERVAILLERSPAWAISQLAVHQAGGCYILLDPDQPQERLTTMLLDARPRALLTTRALAAALPLAVALGNTAAEPPTQLLFVEPWSRPDNPATTLAPASVSGDVQPARPLDPGPEYRASETAILLAGHPRGQASISANGAVRPSAEHLAYIVYTSGSTGTPKGVCTPHRGLENLVAWYQNAFKLGPWDRSTSLAGVGFDATVWEVWPTWAAGACLHLVDDATRMDAVALRDFLLREAITVAFAPTPMAERLLGLQWPAPDEPRPALRVLTTGGDRLHMYPPPGLPFALFNCYGPSECSVCVSAALVEPRDGGNQTAIGSPSTSATAAPATRALPTPGIGFPIANVHCYVLDPYGQLVPIGVPGELYVGGRGVGRGYLNQPALTRAAFVSNVFADGTDDPSRVLYRTGDLVRWSGSGEGLEFLGRVDTQLKIRGYRIEAGEVESHLCAHPAVRAALVVGETAEGSAAGEQLLVAYVERVPEEPAPTATDLRQHLQPRVPAYMVPRRITVLDSLPLTANGKLDRRALQQLVAQQQAAPPARGAARPVSDAVQAVDRLARGGGAAPADPLAVVVRGLWAAALARDDDIDTDGDGTAAEATDDRGLNFFAAGGDSLQATALLAELRAVLNLQLNLRAFFTDRSLATVGGILDAIAAAPHDAQDVIRMRARQVLALWHATDSAATTRRNGVSA